MPQSRELLAQLIQEAEANVAKWSRQLQCYKEALAAEDGTLQQEPQKKRKFWQMAESVLDTPERKALHTTDVARLIQKQFGVAAAPKSLAQMLYAKAKSNQHFFKDKSAENTYGLLKWNK